jgi:hypothetical protein
MFQEGRGRPTGGTAPGRSADIRALCREAADVIDELCDVLRRETEAVNALEGRLRALELIVAADEQNLVSFALGEMEVAADRLAALELTRVLTLSIAGIPVDVAARDLVAGVADVEAGERMRGAVAALSSATERLSHAHHRAEVVVTSGSRTARERLHDATPL